MVISSKKKIITLSIIIGLLTIATIYVLGRRHSDRWGHPFPDYDEIYEWRDPNKGEAVIRAVVTTWTDDTRELSVLMFKGTDGTVWYMGFDRLSLDDPNSWGVFRGSTEKESMVPLSKMQSVSVGTANVGDWQSIDQLNSGSDRK